MHPKALLAFASLAVLLGPALTAVAPKPKPPPEEPPDPEPKQYVPPSISTPDGGSSSGNSASCPKQQYDPRGLFCNVDSGSSILSLLASPTSPAWHIFTSFCLHFAIEIYALLK